MPLIEHLAPAQFAHWVSQHQQAGVQPLLIDVREPWEWQIASIQPAQPFELLRLSMGNIPAELNRLDPDRPTALLCHHGARSLSVAQFLLHNGFEQLANVTGGIDAWSATVDAAVPRY